MHSIGMACTEIQVMFYRPDQDDGASVTVWNPAKRLDA